MIPIVCKITMEQRSWLDKRIKAGEFASYGHCLRYLIGYRRKTNRVVANLKQENAALRERLRLYDNGELEAHTQEEPAVD